MKFLYQENQQRDLGLVIAALARTNGLEDEAEDEMRAFGAPSECMGLVCCGIEKERRKIIMSYGWCPESLMMELQRRVSASWIYKHGFGHLIGV